ncbi:MAG: hypothetical protein L0Y66_08915 [Myxococcaceae bacterium]|nr:hypothetical protein [Myxococcaceae bacterium]MCI0673691.1 hypothetical protein [Myxococcaceae bacterium]
MRRVVTIGLFATFSAFATACGGGDTCDEAGTGDLQVDISGLPAGVAAVVTLQHGSESRSVTTSGRLEGLGGGTWTVQVEPVAAPGGLVRAAYDASPIEQEVCVRDGQTASTAVAYALIPSSQKLWLSTSNGEAEVEAFARESLAQTATIGASVLMHSSPGIPRAAGVAFDRRGNLWVALGSGELRRYPAGALGASGTRTPDVTLTGPALDGGPIAIAFDASGNLWTSIGSSNKVLRFGAAQLTASGSPTPEVELSGLGDPHALAFDASDNLWVGDITSGAPRVHKVAASALTATGTVTPVRSIDAKDNGPVISFSGPVGLAFDAAGNLWVAYGASGVVVRLTPADLGGTGNVSITPSVQIHTGGPKGIAFDEAGNLWMAFNIEQIARLSPEQLATSSDEPTPDVVLTSTDLGATDGVAFYPAPAALPLYHRLP